MKKMFYLLPDFIVRFWCKIFKCSKIESPEQEVDPETDWDKLIDKMYADRKEDAENPNITIVTWPPVKVENKTKLVWNCINNQLPRRPFTSQDIIQKLIVEQNFDISKKDIYRLLSRMKSKCLIDKFSIRDHTTGKINFYYERIYKIV